jgi:hypothetical protein
MHFGMGFAMKLVLSILLAEGGLFAHCPTRKTQNAIKKPNEAPNMNRF